MSSKRIGIVRGGKGKYYEKSLKKGGDLIGFIFENLYPKWIPVDILVDQDDVWHLGGLPTTPANLVHKVDVVWNTSPSVSAILSKFSVPKVDIEALHNLFEDNREQLRAYMSSINISMPKSMILTSYLSDSDGKIEDYATRKADEVLKKFSPPWIVRNVSGKISMGVHVAKTFPELVNAIIDGVEHEGSILVEELVSGKPVSLHTLANYRNEKLYHFPLPKSLSENEKSDVIQFSENLFHTFGNKHYLKTDLILTPHGKISLMNVSFTPDLRDGSHFANSFREVGAKARHILEHILSSAI